MSFKGVIAFLVVVCIGLVIIKYPMYSDVGSAHMIQDTYEYKKYMDLYENSPYSDEYMATGRCYTTVKVAAAMNYGSGSSLKDVNSLRVQPILTILAKLHMKFDYLAGTTPEYGFNSDLTYYLFKSKIAEQAAYSEWVLHPNEFTRQYSYCIREYQ